MNKVVNFVFGTLRVKIRSLLNEVRTSIISNESWFEIVIYNL